MLSQFPSVTIPSPTSGGIQDPRGVGVGESIASQPQLSERNTPVKLGVLTIRIETKICLLCNVHVFTAYLHHD